MTADFTTYIKAVYEPRIKSNNNREYTFCII
jgi:hypothetical protein